MCGVGCTPRLCESWSLPSRPRLGLGDAPRSMRVSQSLDRSAPRTSAQGRRSGADPLCMGASATSADPALTAYASPPGEARQTGGVTPRLILDSVEREGGREAVERLLRSRGLQAREPDLRAEDNWCSYA